MFVTAYDRHALRAFEVHALDYLLKPFDQERFDRALSHARAELERRADPTLDRILALLGERAARRGHAERLVIRHAGRVFFLPVGDIDWIEAAENYVRLRSGAELASSRGYSAKLQALARGRRIT